MRQSIEQFKQEMAQLGAGQSAGLPGVAQQMAAQGRGGDSTLVHMRPDEVAAMQQMARQAGTSMSVNPMTGLPEAFKLKDLFNINTYTNPIQKASNAIGLGGVYNALSDGAKFVGNNAQYILPFIPGAAFANVGLGSLSGTMGRSLLGGVAGAFGGGGRPNLKRGLMAGLTTYGLSSAYEGLQAAGGGLEGGALEADTRAETGLQLPPGAPAEVPTPASLPTPPTMTGEAEAAGRGIKNLMAGDKATSEAAKKAFGAHFGSGKAYATMMGATGVASIDEQEKYLEEARAAGQIAEAQYQQQKARIAAARKRAEDAMRANPYQFAIGGDVPLAMKGSPDTELYGYGLKRGGQTSGRYVDGPGDGMSDSIPAVINGQQPARLTDGEFVIPADVVSHIGNGSSKAGAKQLYAMMARVRQARTGTKQQGKQIDPGKYLPA